MQTNAAIEMQHDEGVPALFRGFGLRIRSALPVPGALRELDAATGEPDLVIEEGPIASAIPDAACGPYELRGRSVLFSMPVTARYLCHARGTRLTVDKASEGSLSVVSAMLIATAIPAALWLRGELVLHAAAAVLPGATHAIAFAGASGSGKSTLLRRLIAAGSTVVGDDTLCVRRLRAGHEEPGAAYEVSGLPGCTFERRAAFAGEGNGAVERAACEVPAGRQRERAPLGAIVVLEPAAGCEPSPPRRLRGEQSLSALLRHRHRPLVPRLSGDEAGLLHRLVALAEAVPIYAWRRKETGAARDMQYLAGSLSMTRQYAVERGGNA